MTKTDMLQRTVPAAGAPRPDTTAPASVFAQAQAAKPKRPYSRATFDPASVTIEAGVPLPPSAAPQRTSPYVGLLQRMKAGDSVRLTIRQAASMRAAAKKAGIKVEVRRLGTDAAGVWRTA